MRLAGIVRLASIVALPALIGLLAHPQAAPAQPGSFQTAEAAKKAKPAPKQAAPKESNGYALMPLAERVGILFDLAWTGHFNGLIDGEFNEKAVAAVKAFQRDNRFRESGVLAPPERAQLAALSKAVQERAGWTMVEDKATGAQVGLPAKQTPNMTRVGSGTRWSSAQGQVQIETFRIREPGTTLAAVFEQQKRQPPNRRPNVNLLRDDFFILSGLQGLKKFYVRAQIRDLEVRGLTILYDQATEGIMDPVTVAMGSAFAPFSGTGLTDLMGATRRKIEYGTGIVVTAGGHILTDRLLVEGCSVIQVGGLGDANRIAENEAAGIALLRVLGAPDLPPAALVHEGATGPDLTLVGIADPQSQAGGHTVSSTLAKLNGAVLPPPPLGFAGAAALDGRGRLFGMVTLKTPVMAGVGAPPLPSATVTPVDTIRRFLDAHYVMPATGRAGVEAAKVAVVRVICVRR
jgi:peptidoglycan hydrolase-like protein with peptidoglycan-binding domain